MPPLAQIRAAVDQVKKDIADSENLQVTSVSQLKEYLRAINRITNSESPVSQLEVYMWFVAKEKAIYNALNMMKGRASTYIGFLWAPIEKEAFVKEELMKFQTTEFSQWRSDPNKPLHVTPPTYFKLNDVTWVFQQITNTYGVPSYEEANPAVFSVVTFPFLFAVMFGDYGHGSLIFFLGLFLCLFHDRLNHGAMKEVQKMRYMVLMMGFFAVYNGLLYNEFFAIPNDWFGSCYDYSKRDTVAEASAYPGAPSFLLKDNFDNCVYKFGVDPAWYLSPQLLTFTNNIKMKLAVIIGVVHMSMGIVVKGLNCIYFKDYLALIFEVFTGIIILMFLFGWMDYLIISKWNYYMNAYAWGDANTAIAERITTAPSIITVMINNFLAGGKQDVYYFENQRTISEVFVVIALICVPLMLCCKPIILVSTMPKHAQAHEEFDQIKPVDQEGKELLGENPDAPSDGQAEIQSYVDILNSEGGDDHGAHNSGEIFIHQLIETIEFVLGTVSNTASYLRLWALSLAHSQLAEVFLEMLLTILWKNDMDVAGLAITTFILWFAFMTVTFAVLMMMDVLECFLHTLRLHWVEFQNKFFKGAGYLYIPFSFVTVFEKEMARQI